MLPKTISPYSFPNEIFHSAFFPSFISRVSLPELFLIVHELSDFLPVPYFMFSACLTSVLTSGFFISFITICYGTVIIPYMFQKSHARRRLYGKRYQVRGNRGETSSHRK